MTAPTKKKRNYRSPKQLGYQAGRRFARFLDHATDRGWDDIDRKFGGVGVKAEYADDGDLLLSIDGGPTQKVEFEQAVRLVREAAIRRVVATR